ncbi:MAG: CBU_0592 family membrane protein [Bacteroidota bacterium]
MTYNDIIGSVGVGLILVAYFLSTEKLLKQDGKLYFVLNIIGAGLATGASLLIGYWPFVILEGTWTLVSIYGLMKAMKVSMT